ncbi:MAG TPA: HepT-like ribonuclease domain-containing protein [Pricia sp.]|nr:HepT-like ribonuclease domain-containing protein [Pricia sp.]
MFDKDKANLLAIIDSASKIKKFTASFSDADSFYDDEKTFDAVLMNFVAIGEFVKRLSVDLTEKHPEVPWIKIHNLRNLFAHNYFGVDAEEVWQIIQGDLEPLVRDIKKILKDTHR